MSASLPSRLPLAAFEELFVHDDHPPHWPAVFSMILEFDGTFDIEVGQNALDFVAERQPLIKRVLERHPSGKLSWVPADESVRLELQVTTSGDVALDGQRPFDLTRELPLRFAVQERNGKTVLASQSHHAAFDGLGALQVISDWLRVYNGLLAGKKAEDAVHRLDNNWLKDRCRAALPWRERIKLLRLSWLSLYGFFFFFRNRPIPLLDPAKTSQIPVSAGQPRSGIPGKLTEVQSEQLKKRAKSMGATVNDLIAVELMCAIKLWQLAHDVQPEGSHIRITIPINERTVRHRRMPSCNHCTMISLDRPPEDLPMDSSTEEFQRFVGGVHFEINVVRQWRLSLAFWKILGFFRRFGGGIAKRFATMQVRSTCVLTNLGDMGQRLRLPKSKDPETRGKLLVGEMAMEGIEIVAPIRYGTLFAIATFTYQKQQCFTMNYDGSLLTRDQAQELLDLFIARLVV